LITKLIEIIGDNAQTDPDGREQHRKPLVKLKSYWTFENDCFHHKQNIQV